MTSFVNLLKSHMGYYVSLLAIQLLGLGLIVLFAPHRLIQVVIVAFLAFAYLGFAFVHHKKHHDLTRKIVLEYVVIAAIGIIVSIFLFTV